ncbi:MAG: hypothetical protein JJE16_00405 [Nitrospiraceae bacterium]|nr:hypothetical protein [Nitrospiraceae bacterium]
MKLLLVSLLVLIPLAVHAEYRGNLSANEFDPNSIADPFGAENPDDPNSITNEFELGPYGNPYSPSSATNFEAITAPCLYDQERNDRGRLSVKTYNRECVSNPYGWYGNPYRADSPNNPYGQGWRIEGR